MLRRRPLLVSVAVLVTLAVGLVPADPAAADPARPTDYRSRVLSVRPTLPVGTSVSVVGGDAFLELQVAPGHTATVPDYEQGRSETVPTYLRFGADGLVERNEASLAAQVNGSRFGSGGEARASGAARWQVVATDGRYAWHDHRIHWMLDRSPTAVDGRGRVDLGGPGGTWEVPLVVDGEPHLVRGELLLLDAPSPAPWAAAAVVVALLVVGGASAWLRRSRVVPHVALAAVLVVVGGAAAVVALVAWRSLPPVARSGPTAALVALVGTLLAGAGIGALLTGRVEVARAALAGSVAALGSWALLRRDVLGHAVLPTSLPAVVDRGVTTLVLGTAIGAAVVLVWRPPARTRPSTAS